MEQQTQPRITARQYLKLHPEKYVLVTYEFGTPVYIGELNSRFRHTATGDKSLAVKWSALDFGHPEKLAMAIAETGYKGLTWEQI